MAVYKHRISSSKFRFYQVACLKASSFSKTRLLLELLVSKAACKSTYPGKNKKRLKIQPLNI